VVAWAAWAITLDRGFLLHGAGSHEIDGARGGWFGQRRPPDLIAA